MRTIAAVPQQFQKLTAARLYCGVLMLTLAVALLASPSPPARAEESDAMAVVKAGVDKALVLLKDTQTPLPERRRQLRDIAESHLDLAYMARSSMGYHWRELSDEQRKEFVPLFGAFIEDAYLVKIQDYVDLQIDFVREVPQDNGYAEVDSQVTRPDHPPVRLNFLVKREGDTWKVYDVTIDGISMINNYRNQFNRVVNNRGIAALMSDLQTKETELASLLGNKQ